MLWPVERLILEHYATRQEIETHYSFEDLMLANEALDLWIEAKNAQQKKG